MPPKPPEDEVMGRAFDARLTKRALQFVLPYKKDFALALVTLIAVSGANVVAPYLLKVAIDDGIKGHNARILSTMAVVYLITYLIRWLFQYWQSMMLASLAQNVTNDIRNKLFGHIQNLSMEFFATHEIGRIISRLMGDVDALNALIVSGALSLITDVLTAIGIVFIMAQLDLHLCLLTFTLLPVIWVVTLVFRMKVRLAYRDVRKKVATVTATVAENVSGVRVVKSFSRERSSLAQFKRVNRDIRRSVMRSVVVTSLFSSMVEIMTVSGIAMVFWYGGGQVMRGAMTIGAFVAFLNYISLFFTPIRSMSQFYTVMQSAMAGAERIFEVLDTESTVLDKPGALALDDIQGKVEFKHVNFSYSETPILMDLSFTANAGETVALVGPTGAGKTTITSLICRQYDPIDGAVMVDGQDIRDVQLHSLRSQIGVVLQESFLFPGSIKENLRYGNPGASDAEVEAAARAVGAHDFILETPQGYKTDVREGGSKLSTGQKQLISFARALLANPRILILDEATSSVDTQTELVIQTAMRELFKNRTSFVIAHRLSTIMEADKILVLSDGQIAQTGTHAELLAQSGLYKKLCDAQFKDE